MDTLAFHQPEPFRPPTPVPPPPPVAIRNPVKAPPLLRSHNRFSVLPEVTFPAPTAPPTPAMDPIVAAAPLPELLTPISPLALTPIPEPPVAPGFPERVYIRSADTSRCTKLPLEIQLLDSGRRFTTSALLDCGATGCFIDPELVRKEGLTSTRLPRALPVYNVDGTLNEIGSIRESVDIIMRFGDHSERMTLMVCGLGKSTVIVGHPWLHQHNPEIDWRADPDSGSTRLVKGVRMVTPGKLAFRARMPLGPHGCPPLRK